MKQLFAVAAVLLFFSSAVAQDLQQYPKTGEFISGLKVGLVTCHLYELIVRTVLEHYAIAPSEEIKKKLDGAVNETQQCVATEKKKAGLGFKAAQGGNTGEEIRGNTGTG
jgi:hypothetical protein